MKASLINKLCCPFDKKDLDVQIFVRDQDEQIIEGLLTCTHCKRYYPIVHGVPIMSPDEYREPQLETPLLQRWENRLEGISVSGFRLLSAPEEK